METKDFINHNFYKMDLSFTEGNLVSEDHVNILSEQHIDEKKSRPSNFLRRNINQSSEGRNLTNLAK